MKRTTERKIVNMAEFGENLKRVREEKGITQQTLADYLYVTRQAVSRWEGGSRYPDIMTAKKMAQYLEVTLDELLSDDDMKLYTERSSILESQVSKKIQLILLTIACMSAFLCSVLDVSNYFIDDYVSYENKGEMIKSILFTIILAYGIWGAIQDKLTPKIMAMVSSVFFGTAIITGVYCMCFPIDESIGFLIIFMGLTLFNLAFLGVTVRFFLSKRSVSPIPIYVFVILNIVMGMFSFVLNQTREWSREVARDMFVISFFSQLQTISFLVLLMYMAHTLHNKRKRAER